MANLLLGPMQRYVGSTDATVWVEADEPCEVSVLGQSVRTFTVGGHHYALLVLRGLEPGTVTEYGVDLDGEQAWPVRDDPYPPPVIRTRPAEGDERVRISFGSCRTAAPHREPWTLDRHDHPQGRGTDALAALARRMQDEPHEDWPDTLLLLGDQVYADDASPETRAFIRSRRDPSQPPGEEVADFEEYTRLYQEAWSEPLIRWLLSTVPVAMIFDDHDVIDDWNISASWLEDMRAKPWWDERITAGLVSYWCYQHLGNLHPDSLESDELFREVCAVEDAEELLHDFAWHADREASTAMWSYERDIGPVKLVVIDSRAGRVLDEGRRSMLDEPEWEFIEDCAAAPARHLMLATSLPYLLPPGIHGLEAWNEALCDGRWGGLMGRVSEGIRRAVDLEHWAAFQGSFARMARLVADVGAGRRGQTPPGSIVFLSGDVHHSYLARARFPRSAGVRSPVWQAVASPMRNPVEPPLVRVYRFATSRLGTRIGTFLARRAGVPEPPIRWDITEGPWFVNQVSTIDVDGPDAVLRVEGVEGGARTADESPRLELVHEHRLT